MPIRHLVLGVDRGKRRLGRLWRRWKKRRYFRPSAEKSHADVFALTGRVTDRLHEWIDLADIPDDGTALGFVKAAFLVRAFNAYRTVPLLLSLNHWEEGLMVVRSLFELLLNAEEIDRRPDPEAAAHQFVRFSLVQEYRAYREQQLYEVASGRAGEDTRERIDRLDEQMRRLMEPFWHIDRRGRGRWRTNWCNKDVATLSRESRNPLREHQYRLVYPHGSNFIHSTPTAVLAATQMREPGSPVDLGEFVRHADETERKGVRSVASLATLFLLEILLLFGDRLPDYDPVWVAEMSDSVVAFASE